MKIMIKKCKNYKKVMSNTDYRYFIKYSYNDKYNKLHYSSCIIKVNNKIKSNNDLKYIKKRILLIDSCLETALCERFSSYAEVQSLDYKEKIEFLSLSILDYKLINTKVR